MSRFKRPNAATIIAFMALFAVLGGSSYAASKITSAQIKNGTIKTVDMSSSAKRALKGNRGPQGPAGPQGAAGPQGPAGPSAVGQITTVNSPQMPFGAEVVQSATAYCPAGQRVISGGGVSISDEQLAASMPTPGRTGWYVIGVDLVEDGTAYIQATANCAPANGAVAASASRESEKRYVARMVAKVEAQRSR